MGQRSANQLHTGTMSTLPLLPLHALGCHSPKPQQAEPSDPLFAHPPVRCQERAFLVLTVSHFLVLRSIFEQADRQPGRLAARPKQEGQNRREVRSHNKLHVDFTEPL